MRSNSVVTLVYFERSLITALIMSMSTRDKFLSNQSEQYDV